jgi:hypothetical protein
LGNQISQMVFAFVLQHHFAISGGGQSEGLTGFHAQVTQHWRWQYQSRAVTHFLEYDFHLLDLS